MFIFNAIIFFYVQKAQENISGICSHMLQLYLHLVCSTSLLKPRQINSISLQTEVLLLLLNGNADGAVDKYFFPDCLDPFLPGYHLRYQMTFPALSFFFSFSPHQWEGCKGALPAAGNQFIQSRAACRERWDRAGLI